MKQRNVFLSDAADDWYERNAPQFNKVKEPIGPALETAHIRPKRILEIGCSNGTVLHGLHCRFNAECYGIDPSQKAISNGQQQFPGLTLAVGTAEKLPFDDGFFDVVLFGHSLYLCDPAEYFLISKESDRVLANNGFIVIKDFLSEAPYKNPYSHKTGIYSHKMEFSKMFTWHPFYRLLSRSYFEHGNLNTFSRDEAISVDIIHKCSDGAFPEGAR